MPLARELAVLDTDAYLSSPRAIGFHSAGRWPTDGFTLEENLALIAHHEAEHRAGDAFAYAILGPHGDQEWGCVYLRPLAPYLERTATRLALPEATIRSAAIATFWLIDDTSQRPTATEVLGVVESWTAEWRAAPVVFRCLPEESESLSALEASAMDRVDASAQPLPYLWFLVVPQPRQPGLRALEGVGSACPVAGSVARAGQAEAIAPKLEHVPPRRPVLAEE